MGAILFTYLSIGAYWVYIELASLSNGISDSWVSGVLFWSSLLTLIGCAFAAYFNNRYGLAKPLIGAQILMMVIIGMLISGITNINLLISVFMFNFLWIFNDVFQMATVAILDKDGSFAALVPGAQGLGQIIGPNIAATILGAQYGYSEVFIMCMIAIAISVIIYLLMQKRLKLYAPKLLDA
jgi:MFS family permease